MRKPRYLEFLLLLTGMTVLFACGPTQPVQTGGGQSTQSSGGEGSQSRGRTLALVGRSEIPSLSARPLQTLGLTSETTVRLFNAGLSNPDDRGVARPYLAESLPTLGADSWRVSPDGRMETTYKLRSGLTWQDGAPLTANDFVFSWEVFSVPELGQSGQAPMNLIDEVSAPDATTVLFKWRRLYADAGALNATGGTGAPTFPPLPRHLLDESFHQGNWDSFVGLPAWNVGYIGAGPYKLDQWVPGAYLDATAFDGHALGKAKIERVRITWAPDFNATVATMLAGDAHLAIDDSIRFQQGLILKREWAQRNGGTVLVYPSLWRWTTIQQRPELASPRSLTDVRVRKALAYGVDKAALNEVLFEGEGIMTEVPVPPNESYFAEVDRASIKYAYDPRMTEQLMMDVGYSKDSSGVYTNPSFGRFSADLAVFQSPQNESEMSIMAASWRQLGFDVKELVWPATQARDAALRNTHPNLSVTSGPPGEATLLEHQSAEIPRADIRWAGSNRGGWSNPEFDRLANAYNGTLDKNERVDLLAQMSRVFSDDVAVISLYFNPSVSPFVAALTGPTSVVPTSNIAWNVWDWQLR